MYIIILKQSVDRALQYIQRIVPRVTARSTYSPSVRWRQNWQHEESLGISRTLACESFVFSCMVGCCSRAVRLRAASQRWTDVSCSRRIVTRQSSSVESRRCRSYSGNAAYRRRFFSLISV